MRPFLSEIGTSTSPPATGPPGQAAGVGQIPVDPEPHIVRGLHGESGGPIRIRVDEGEGIVSATLVPVSDRSHLDVAGIGGARHRLPFVARPSGSTGLPAGRDPRWSRAGMRDPSRRDRARRATSRIPGTSSARRGRARRPARRRRRRASGRPARRAAARSPREAPGRCPRAAGLSTGRRPSVVSSRAWRRSGHASARRPSHPVATRPPPRTRPRLPLSRPSATSIRA